MKKPTLCNLLRTALLPVGQTMYIWGGGWNDADDGAGIDAVTLGCSPRWAQFCAQQDHTYDWHETRYQLRDGLDCSGYVGWVLYNLFAVSSGGAGYVMPARKMARHFAALGWGTYHPASAVSQRRAGDIMSTSGHVYIVLGECMDGSVLLTHASPPGVQVSGTVTPSGCWDSQAIHLASCYMKACHPDWYARFPESARPLSYLEEYDRFTWQLCGSVLRDPERLSSLSAANVLARLVPR